MRIGKLEDLAESAIAQFRADIERIIGRLTAYLEENAAALAEEDGHLLDSPSNVEIAEKWARDLSRVLTDLGWDDSIHGLLDRLEEVHDSVAGHIEDQLGGSYTHASGTTLAAFADGTVEELLAVKGRAGEKLRSILLLGMRTHLARDKEIADLALELGGTLRQAASLADTSMMAFQREALIDQAEEGGIDLFVYTGPDDSLTRPFCADHVGKVYTSSDLDDEDNGQGLEPTSRYLGGFNCRHYLSPITVDRAKALADSGGDDVIAGTEAQEIVFEGKSGSAERRFVAENTGAVVKRDGRQRVVRRRAA